MIPDRPDTELTALGELAAARNEDLTIANGSLAGEKRAAVTRLAVIAMFGLSTELVPRLHGHAQPLDIPRAAILVAYAAFAAMCLVSGRRAKPDPRRVVVRPAIYTLVDFAFVGVLAVIEIAHGHGMNAELTAAVSAILISFTIVRAALWHVLLSVICAVLAYSALAAIDGRLSIEAVVYVDAGFVGLGIIVALTNRAVRRMFQELRHRDNLTRFLPQQVAERLLRSGPEALAPVEREVTVLFSDIRGFTALSEGLEPRAVLALLDTYYGRIAQVIKGHDGVVGKFIGDGILAFWNVPDRDPEHARKAVRAARDMLRALDELNDERAHDGQPGLQVGIGIHTGTVAAGMLGGGGQSEYTVIGDTVNVASRVEGLTKSLGVEIVITEPTRLACGERLQARRLAAERIRGRKEPVLLFAVDREPAAGSRNHA